MRTEHNLVITPALTIKDRKRLEKILEKEFKYIVMGGGESSNDKDCGDYPDESYIDFVKL